MNGITEQRNRAAGAEQERSSGAAPSVERSEAKGVRKQPVERSIDGVQRKVRAVAEGIKKFTPDGRKELRERAEQERREAERIARERESVKDRQRINKLEHEKSDRNFDIGR